MRFDIGHQMWFRLGKWIDWIIRSKIIVANVGWCEHFGVTGFVVFLTSTRCFSLSYKHTHTHIVNPLQLNEQTLQISSATFNFSQFKKKTPLDQQRKLSANGRTNYFYAFHRLSVEIGHIVSSGSESFLVWFSPFLISSKPVRCHTRNATNGQWEWCTRQTKR